MPGCALRIDVLIQTCLYFHECVRSSFPFGLQVVKFMPSRPNSFRQTPFQPPFSLSLSLSLSLSPSLSLPLSIPLSHLTPYLSLYLSSFFLSPSLSRLS